MIWDLDSKETIKKVNLDIFDRGGEKLGKKSFISYDTKTKRLNHWLADFKDKETESIGILMADAPDFQQNNHIAILNQKGTAHLIFNEIIAQNLIPYAIYLAVRQCIKATWLNDRDQFLTPNKKWKQDKEFHNDCLAFSLFHSQNKITSREGINHFIPFREKEVDSKGIFESHFLNDFIAGKLKADSQNDNLFGNDENSFIPTSPMVFSEEASAVFEAGKNLWRYYHAQDFGKNDIWHEGDFSYLNDYNANASLYDIKAYFQGFNEKGRMNARSKDSCYNDLIANLRYALESLASKIAKKVYEYEFLES